MMNPTTFEPVILKNVCSKTYLDMFMHMIPSVELWENTEESDVMPDEPGRWIGAF